MKIEAGDKSRGGCRSCEGNDRGGTWFLQVACRGETEVVL